MNEGKTTGELFGSLWKKLTDEQFRDSVQLLEKELKKITLI